MCGPQRALCAVRRALSETISSAGVSYSGPGNQNERSACLGSLRILSLRGEFFSCGSLKWSRHSLILVTSSWEASSARKKSAPPASETDITVYPTLRFGLVIKRWTETFCSPTACHVSRSLPAARAKLRARWCAEQRARLRLWWLHGASCLVVPAVMSCCAVNRCLARLAIRQDTKSSAPPPKASRPGTFSDPGVAISRTPVKYFNVPMLDLLVQPYYDPDAGCTCLSCCQHRVL